MNRSYNPDVTQYSLYSVYTAAHEGTFFDQSAYADLSTLVPAGNHLNLDLSLSKHSTYNFNPNLYPITPAGCIVATNEGLAAEFANGDIDDILEAKDLADEDAILMPTNIIAAIYPSGWKAFRVNKLNQSARKHYGAGLVQTSGCQIVETFVGVARG